MSSLERTIHETQRQSITETQELSTKVDQLVRLGLMPVPELPFLKRAFMHMGKDMFLPIRERQIFYRFVAQLMRITLENPALWRLIKNKTGALRREELSMAKETIDEAAWSPKTGASCSCRRGVERDNCPRCEGSGQVINFKAIHAAREAKNKTVQKEDYLTRFNAAFLEFVDTQNEAIISANNLPKPPPSQAVKDEIAQRKTRAAADKERLMASAKKEYDDRLAASRSKSAHDPSRKLFNRDRVKQS